MRLGDASNFSTHGRTSTSTLDDALSGKAEPASSSEESDDGSDDEQELPPLPYTSVHSNGLNGEYARGFDSGDTSGEEYDDHQTDSFKGESDDIVPDEHHDHRIQMSVSKARSSISSKTGKPSKSRSVSKSKGKPNGATKPPMSPTSLPTQSRKASSASLNFQHQLGADEEDLSSKPRCQRCRKSKKGCDRQRPCQRCKDAGIGIEGCISEDEGNGRKGRYGRHMGVPVKKSSIDGTLDHEPGLPTPIITSSTALNGNLEKSKKRKR
jgi:cell division septation protein DedD